jgi:hypothetical protein
MSREFDALPQAVRLALQQGRPIDAVRLLREAKGISLKAAQARVQAAAAKGVPGATGAAGPAMPPPAPGQVEHVGHMGQPGHSGHMGTGDERGALPDLLVTRLLRALRAAERRRAGLPEVAALRAAPGALAPGEQPRSGGVAGWLVVALLVLLAALVVRRLA